MVQKVLPGEYLKAYEAMTAMERKEYRCRVGEWLSTDGERLLSMTDRPMAQAQNLMQMSVRWSKEDCRVLHDGAVLVSALMGVAETWLPSQLWVKGAWRSVRHITSLLSEVKNETAKFSRGNRSAQTEAQLAQTAIREAQKRAVKELAQMQNKNVPDEKEALNSQLSTLNSQGIVPVRPKHIDQYLHLLPKGTQERGGLVRGLLRELDDAREKARLLMGSPQASPASMAAWAQKATKIDGQLGKIYKELDTEWEKLVQNGRVIVDELGQAHVIEVKSEESEVTKGGNQKSQSAKRGRKPMTENEKAARAAEKEAKKRQENQRKAGLLRKWLIDLRNAKTPEQREKWRKKYKEMVKLGGEGTVTEKVKAAAIFYGISLEGVKN